jgi:sirohydrochlorin ferrochelatase
MTAPALITLAHGSRDPRSVTTIKALTEQVACMRPDLRIETAFLELAEPSFEQSVDRLVAEGHDEIVVVPLLLSEAYHAKVDVPAVIAAAEASHPGVRIELTNVLGLEPSVFHVLDRRLREALAHNRVRELDGLVLAGAGSSDPVVNAAIARAARQWGQRHRLPIVAAFASQAPPAAGEAVRALRADGRRHIAVGLLFLAPGFLTDRVTELAEEAGAVAVAEPIGADQEIAEIILARYAVGAVDLVDLDALFADV